MNKIFNKKAIRIVERYDQNQNIDTSNSFGLYPRNKKQEDIVKMFSKIIRWIESHERGEEWLNSIRKQTHFNPNILSIGDYFVNVTSNKTPDYLIITNEEEMEQVRKQTDYALVLSLPLL